MKNRDESTMELDRRLNRDILTGWSVVVAIQFIAYSIETVKGLRPYSYVLMCLAFGVLPILFCLWKFKVNPANHMLRYYLVGSYFVTYLFCLFTGATNLVFVYILPLFALLILYHQPSLIIGSGITAMVINAAFIIKRVLYPGDEPITLENSRDAEIQMVILFLCMMGAWMSTVIYDEIQKRNAEYMEKIGEKSAQIQRMTFQTIETIANTIDAKDDYTKGHSRRVSDYSAEIAREMGLSREDVERIRYIALLHDIGKIGVPDAVLNKPGRLTDAEYDLMKKHTTIGGDILKDVGMMQDLDVGAKYHHERYDGKGYPYGLKGEEIPLIARIICMADSYDAMTSNRIYRKHLNHRVVLEEVKRCRGTQFDPDVTDAFLRFLEKLDGSSLLTEVPEQMEGANRLLDVVMEDQTKRLAEAAQRDQLTKVYNRSAGERFIAVAMRDTTGFLFYFNIDDMRRINREQGVRMGDFYLLQIVDLLQCMNPDIIVSRFGGDEFVCYIPGTTDTDEISAQMKQLLEGVRFIALDTCGGRLTASVGISIHEDTKQTFADALAEADKALYFMKQSGKDSFYFYRQVENMEEDLSRQELSKLVDAIRFKDNFSDSMVLGQQDFFRMFEFITDVVKDRRHNVTLVMFTLTPSETVGEPSVEDRDKALACADKAILEVVHDSEAISTYSSTQRIVTFVDDTPVHVKEVVGEIEKKFYHMYGQHSERREIMSLEYRIASIQDDSKEKEDS
ncbi:MAG: diguanylate cyclase [Lachnospiraceae bacterium]|nr:diguanylate cyclase [Lachnospiraceae bacterium]